jgi:soluble lytic murein transglycosylase-like protein
VGRAPAWRRLAPSGGWGATITGGHRPIRSLVAALACAALLALPVAAHAGGIRNPAERHAAKQCDQGRALACIRRAALHYHVDEPRLRFIAWRESRYQPGAVNPSSGAAGLFQFLASTWAHTRYAGHSPLSAKWNALAAAWMVARTVYGWSPWAT